MQQRYDRDKHIGHDHRPLLVALGSLIICLFVFVDYGLDPAHIWHSALIRFGFFAPCAALSIHLLRQRRHPVLDELLCLTISLIATVCCITAAPVYDAVTSITTQIDIILLVSAISTLRMRLPFNLAFIAILFVSDTAYLHHTSFLSRSEKVCALSLVACCAILAIIASYRIELADRLAYVLFLREELRTKELSRLNDNLQALSFRDGLTGLANRRHFDACFEAAWRQAAADRTPVSLVMTDVDHFKHLNDTHGHIAGDQVLIQLAGILQTSSRREKDVVARFGGEEFVLLLPSSSEREALLAAEHLRCTLRSVPLEVDSVPRPLSISVSCGVATLHPHFGLDATDLIALADQALYRAKRSGRDRVCT